MINHCKFEITEYLYKAKFLIYIFSLVRTQKRISNGLKVLQYYTTRPWKFRNEKIMMMSNILNEDDRAVFYTDVAGLNWDNYLLSYILGARKYCVHEEPDTLPQARKLLRR